MNKCLYIIKNILLISLLVFIGLFINKYYLMYSSNDTFIIIRPCVLIMFATILIYFIIKIINLFNKKNKTKNNLRYNLINVIGLIPINLVFIRILFDKTIISNVEPTSIIPKYELIGFGYSYIESNSYIVIIILVLLIIYYFLNKRKSTK